MATKPKREWETDTAVAAVVLGALLFLWLARKNFKGVLG